MLKIKIVLPATTIAKATKRGATVPQILAAAQTLGQQAIDFYDIPTVANQECFPWVSASFLDGWRVYVKCSDYSHEQATVSAIYRDLEGERHGEDGMLTDASLMRELGRMMEVAERGTSMSHAMSAAVEQQNQQPEQPEQPRARSPEQQIEQQIEQRPAVSVRRKITFKRAALTGAPAKG